MNIIKRKKIFTFPTDLNDHKIQNEKINWDKQLKTYTVIGG